MKKLLLGIVAACMATPMVAQDPATYQPVNGYSIENLWMKSVATNNNMDELVGGNRSRGMTVRNGEVLYSYRSDFTGIKVYDLKTGDFKKDVKFDTEKFKVSYAYTKVDTVVNAPGDTTFNKTPMEEQKVPGFLCNDRKNRLLDSIVIGTGNIFSNLSLLEGFLHRSSRCSKQCPVQDLEGQIQLIVQTGADDCIVCKISLFFLRIIFSDRIIFFHPFRFIKRRLRLPGRIHRLFTKIFQIMLMDKFQILIRIHISIKINIAVRRVIVSSVEIKKSFIGKIRHRSRVSAGFKSIRSIRKQRFLNNSCQLLIRR